MNKIFIILSSVSLALFSCSQPVTDERIVEITKPQVVPEAFILRIDTSLYGSISLTPEAEKYTKGTTVKITAQANEGYTFTGFTGTLSSTKNPTLITVAKDEWIIPVFSPETPEPQPIEYTVRVDSSPNGTVTYDPVMPNNLYPINSFVKITAVPSDGYVFSGWTGTMSSTQNPLVIKATTNTWLVPQFTKKATYQVITNFNSIGGSVTVTPNKIGGYTYGEKCTLTAIADPNYKFDGWIGDYTRSLNSLYLTMTGDVQVEACFSFIPSDTTHTFTVTQPTAGTGSLDWTPKRSRYSENEIVRVTAIPASGYMFDTWNDNSSTPIIRDFTVTNDIAISASFKLREWTHIVYMAGDNNLDIHALNDLNELEAASLNNKSISILALIDRKSGNGSWSDTRLYEIITDPLGNSGTIVSKRLDCVNLDLRANAETELDMSNPATLKNLLQFTQESYKAQNYSLIMWGHGSGWRGINPGLLSATSDSRAVAIEEIDSNNIKYMGIRDFAKAIKNSSIKLETIAFDTCFGAEIEVVYELVGAANYFIGSAGVVDVNGWNYSDVFTRFGISSLSTTDFNTSVINSFKEQYSSSSGNPTISLVKLSEVSNLQIAFNTWAGLIASRITTLPLAEELRKTINDLSRSYYYGNSSSDYYADTYELVKAVSSLSHYSNVSTNHILNSLNSAVVNSWSRTIPNEQNTLGVYVVGVNASKIFNTTTSPGYTNGSGQEANAFVTETPHWSATTSNFAVKSLIDKMFFTVVF